MRNSVTPKLLFYGILLIGILLAMVLDSCQGAPGPDIEVSITSIGPRHTNFQVQGIRDDNTVILRDLDTGATVLMEVENPYSQAYETGLLITLIK